MLSASETARKQEAEKKLLEAFMAQCGKVLDSMRDVPPAEAERIRQRLDDARKLSAKAIMLGANQDFQHAVRRKLENIMLTGGVEHHGPTAAKPLAGTLASHH